MVTECRTKKKKIEEIMKKFYSFLFAAVALVGFAACNSDSTEEPAPAQQVGKMEFTANIGEDTKTSLNGTKVQWCEEDVITINGEEFTIKSIDENGTATFEGPVVEAPYKANYGGVILADNVAADTFAEGANIAVAYSETTELSFKNLMSVLKFQVSADCETITFEATEIIKGEFSVDYEYETMMSRNSDDTNKTMTLAIDGGFKAGTTYYTTILPGEYDLTISIDGYLSTTKTAKEGGLQPNTIYNIGTLSAPVKSEYGVVGSFQGWDVAVGKPVAMYEINGWAIAKGVELYKTDEFKIVKGNSWTTSYGLSAAGVLPLGKETNVVTSNSQNMKAAKNGKFDISFNATAKKIMYTCVEEYTGTVEITINNKANWSPLYITLKDGNTTIVDKATVTNNKFAVSMDYIGSSLSYTLSNGTKTMEGNVTIAKNGATINLEETVILLKVQLDTDNAKQWWGNKMCIYVWNTGTSFDSSAWPGHTMTKEANYTWSIQVPSELVGKTITCIVNNGGDWKSNDPTKITIDANGTTVTGSSIGIN